MMLNTMMKNFLFTLLLVSLTMVTGKLLANQPGAPEIEAKSYILIDYLTGKVLLESEAEQVLPPASLTKIMTSYVVSDELKKGNISPDDKVLISENAWAQNPKLKGSSLMFVEVNKYVSVDELHKGIVISSGNDASIAMAEHISGTEDAFAKLMNQHALALGLDNTYFANSTGLPADGHQTSAKDLAKLSQALIRNFPEDYRIYAEKEYTYNKITQQNRNTLLKDQSMQVDGLKTGHTEEAGFGLVSSAVKDEMRLIAVVMGAESKAKRASESRKILNHGFRFYTNITPFKGGASLKNARVWKGEANEFAVGLAQDATLTILKTDKERLKANYIIDSELIAPIRKGQKVGEVFFKIDGKEIMKMPMVALEEVPEAGFFGRMWDGIKLWF